MWYRKIRRTTLVHSARAFFALALALVVFGAAVAPVAADDPAPNPGTANYEIKFMQDMIDHHHMAIMMAEMCLEKAVHPELEAMCQDIIATQSAEIQQMQTWLADWYGIQYEPQMHPGHMQMMERMAMMTPEEFEMHFMETMIRHHRQAVREAETCVRRAYHDELQSLCENIIVTQTAEIQQMEAWLCEWYGICR